jgi:hypothetical protein
VKNDEGEEREKVYLADREVVGMWNNIRYLPAPDKNRQISGIYIGANSIINNLLPSCRGK